MTARQIREKYLEFFKSKGHTIVASDLLVPENDPTLLFTGAGMNQFKEQFMGKNITYSRATSCQKCFRTGDLENVGKTPRHHTFFEMLGNFSFGDYFKAEAIAWAWEFMTEVLSIPADKLWVSVYEDDEESYDIWSKDIKVPEQRIVRLGEHDNFWPADAPSKGPNGPCGPCSEIFFDRGEELGCDDEGCNPACDCGRFVEVWNLVFTQFERKPDGSLDPLPNKNIDTGMGLERITAVIQGVKTNFDTDLFVPITEKLKDLDPERFSGETDTAVFHLIADHVRAATFAIADGVSPSNEKQGYVVRKLIRRAYLRTSRKGPFLYNLVPTVVSLMKDAYPELEEKREHICAILKEEEKRFDDTLQSAMPILKGMLEEDGNKLSAQQIFKLVDTYGLPVDIIEEEVDVPLDMDGFNKLMDERREQSRKGSDITEDFIFKPDKFDGVAKPETSDELPLSAKVEFILLGEEAVDSVEKGQRAEIVTSPQSSMFYAEGGGQVGDTGHIEKQASEIRILDTFNADGRKVLVVFVKKGSLSKGDKVVLHLDENKKQKTAMNHTATHLLQAALREVLGDQVKQSGSSVDDKRLRFDFTHMKKMTDREILKVEEKVNRWISESMPVAKEVKSIDEAKKEGALSFFGEKYGDSVRVVTVGGASKELCGGTHVDNASEIEVVKIVTETSVASGIRRIEAVTGDNARAWVKENLKELYNKYSELASSQKDDGVTEEVIGKVRDIVEGDAAIDKNVIDEFDSTLKPALAEAISRLEKARKKKAKLQAAGQFDKVKAVLDEALKKNETVGGIPFISSVLEDVDMGVLRKAAFYMEKKIDSGVLVLGSSSGENASLICAVSHDLAEKGLDAKEIISHVSGHIKGGGGGKPTFAQAGGKDASGLAKAVDASRQFIENK